MIDPPAIEKLCEISTNSSLLIAAHVKHGDAALKAQAELLERYFGAAYWYLRAVVRDPHDTDDLAQEFSLAFLRGELGRYEPGRGRFRDYLKGALGHLLADYFSRRKARPAAVEFAETVEPALPPDDAGLDREFQSRWRDQLLNCAWMSLAEVESQSGTPYYQVLLARVTEPAASIASMTVDLGARLKRELNESAVRQILRRAREKFAKLLIDEVSRSLGGANPEWLRQELADLDLLVYCQSALENRRSLVTKLPRYGLRVVTAFRRRPGRECS
jgi:RNA polymerase sigma-70 factor (ECF subfamily)